jgi:hypothetical protein
MQQLLFLALLAIGFQSCVSSGKLITHPTQWTEDGPSETEPIHYDSLSKVYYQLERDANNLYLHLSSKDLATQMQIMRFGVKVWLDATAKKKTKVGFEFPLAPPDSVAGQMMGGRSAGRGGMRPNAEREGRREGGGPPSPEEMQKRMLARIYKHFNKKPKELIQIGFEGNDKKKQKFVLGQDACDILVDLEIINENELHYFAVIPIKKVFGDNKAKLMSLGIEIGYLDMDLSMMPPAEGNDRRARFMKMLEEMTTQKEIWFNADLKKQ